MTQTVLLGDVCDILDNLRKPVTKSDRIPGPYPYYGATGILDYVDKYIFDKQTVLVGEDGAKWGPGERTAFIVDGKYWVNNHAHVLRSKKDLANDKWLVYFLNFSDLNKYITGVTVPKLNQKKLREIALPYMKIEDQKQIVKKLDEAFAKIEKAKENTEKNLKNAQELFEHSLEKIFSTPHWIESKLEDVLVETTNINWPKEDNEKIYIDLTSVDRNSSLIKPSLRVNKHNAPNRAKKIVLKNDVIFGTTRPTLKRIALISDKFNDQICSTGFCVLRSDKEKINNKIVYYFLKTKKFMNKVEKLQRGASYPAVTDGDVKSQIMRYPEYMDEQEKIVQKLDKLYEQTQRLQKLYRQKLDDLEELKQSILSQAFSGKP